jgi:hypothetical protein
MKMHGVEYKRISRAKPIYWGLHYVGERSIYVYADPSLNGSAEYKTFYTGPYFVRLEGKYREVKNAPVNRSLQWVIVGSNAEYTRYKNQPKMYSKPKYVK